MSIEARCLAKAETLMAQKPGWIDFLPADPTNIALEYIPYSSSPNGEYSVVISKPIAIPGEAETIEQITVSEQEIEDAASWLSNAYSKFIDQHDDEGHSLRLTAVRHVITDVDSARTRSNPVLAFARQNFKAQLAQIAQSQS